MAHIALPHGPMPSMGDHFLESAPSPVLDASQQDELSSEFKFPSLPATASTGSALAPTDGNSNQRSHPAYTKTEFAKALPAFSFNPSAAASQQSSQASPLPSPTSDAPPTPTRGGRHRRNGSEFIGGGNRSRGSSIRSISPTKPLQDYAQPDMNISPEQSQPSRRGHRHRRSGAVSSQDLSAVTNLSVTALPSIDQPLTPLQEMSPLVGRPQTPPSSSAANSSNIGRVDLDKSDSDSPPPPRSPNRNRVEFSDALEYIPRPLSMVSTESESSMSTIRGHSISGSISSILNSASSSPPPRPRLSPSPTSNEKQAGIVEAQPVGFSFPATSSTVSDTLRVQASASAAHGETTVAHEQPESSPGYAANMGNWTTGTGKPPKLNEEGFVQRGLTNDQDMAVNSAASANHAEYADFDDLEANFDGDPTATVIGPSGDSPPKERDLQPSPVLDKGTRTEEFDSPVYVIDLDAALGPSTAKSPSLRHGKGKTFSAARYSMHSSAFLKSPGDFGNQYHRRAESAPQLVPFHFDQGPGRDLHSSSATEKGFEMEDVFEEDEEERNEAISQSFSTIRPSQGNKANTTNQFPQADATQLVNQDLDFRKRPLGPQYDAYSDLGPPQAPFVLPNTPTGSTASSPRFAYSDSSPVTPRLDTSASSFTESFKAPKQHSGEPGSVRQSVDDVPSLVSSRSTMASGGPFVVPSPSIHSLAAQSASMESLPGRPSVAEVRRKRASIASLSRLMGGSFNGKSNLNYEESVRCHTSDGIKDAGEKRGNRLSKLFRFLKSKPAR